MSDLRERVLAGIDQRLTDSSPAAMDYRKALQFAREEIEQHKAEWKESNVPTAYIGGCAHCNKAWPCSSVLRAARLFLGEK